MPEIEIRPATVDDIPTLTGLDHSYASDYVWQMEIQRDEHQVGVIFREARLPRSVQVMYPRSPKALIEEWDVDPSAPGSRRRRSSCLPIARSAGRDAPQGLTAGRTPCHCGTQSRRKQIPLICCSELRYKQTGRPATI